MPGMSTPAAKRAGASTSFQLERGWRAAGEAGEQGERLERSWREAGERLEGSWRERLERDWGELWAVCLTCLLAPTH